MMASTQLILRATIGMSPKIEIVFGGNSDCVFRNVISFFLILYTHHPTPPHTRTHPIRGQANQKQVECGLVIEGKCSHHQLGTWLQSICCQDNYISTQLQGLLPTVDSSVCAVYL